MKYAEYGAHNSDVIILLHGGGLSQWNYEQAAKALQNDYRVILPILDGHAGSDAPFASIEDNAAEIIDFIDTHFKGSVLLMGGLSLGGQVLLEILAERGDICKCAVVESAVVIPSKLTHSLIAPAFGSCFGLIRQKWFSKLQFRSLKIKKDLFDDYFADTCAIKKADMIAFLQANCLYTLKDTIKNCKAKALVVVGEKENSRMKKSAEMIHKVLEGSVLKILPGLYHGEFSINHGAEYAAEIEKLLKE